MITTDRTLCEVIAIDARYTAELGLTPVTVVTDDGQAALYLADDRDLGPVTDALADDQMRVAIWTDSLIVGLDVTPHQEDQ